jgi:hypothetical protein
MPTLAPRQTARFYRDFLQSGNLIQEGQIDPGVLSPLATKASVTALSASLALVARSGRYSDLLELPTIPSTPGDLGAATAEQGARADTAVQLADLGSAAVASVADFATAAQGSKADSALQPFVVPLPAYTFRITASRSVDGGAFDVIPQSYDLVFNGEGRLVSAGVSVP